MVDFYSYEELGFIIDPPSDTKEIFIPSPPTMTTVKINPRNVILYIAGGKIVEGYENLDALKTFAETNKVVLVCPESTVPEEIAETYTYITGKAKVLNIKRDSISIMADSEFMETAQELVDYLVDECDADLEDAEEFTL